MADTGDRMLCHACGYVWPRSEHELECPRCSSDFTEIVEIPPDPDPELDSHPDPPISVPRQRSPSSPPPPPANPWMDHDPWAHQDDDDDDDEPSGWETTNPGYGFTRRTYRSPNGRFTFSSTTYTHGFPRRPSGSQRDVTMDPLVRGIDSFFQSMTDANRPLGHASQQRPRSPGRMFDTNDDFEPPHAATRQTEYHPTGGLFPRDADGPQPMGTPLRTLGDILELFRTDVGTGPGVRGMAGTTPLALLSALLNLERNGDAVYSQEELDRVISQLVEQNGNRTAPPPATPDAIRSLPKKAVDQEMLGSEGKAECSICMDSVKVGDEVTVLPCQHWFHAPCIEMWLNQHNTCPHCRRSIDLTTTPDLNTTTTPFEGTSGTRRLSGSSRSSVYPSLNTTDEESDSRPRRASRGGEGPGGWAGWVRNRFGGGT
ncbi:hypothetical protein AOCH_004439 [Aspergillus ochraceoroseus]|uniref:RING-type E3 ubiquitin transferase n=2 Tax=Aspergillus ochraceoroseus TaxID=138278 RepID=A0A0F8UEF7_9EURO|nr:hypothetical protein AOCH_004439 [Aspergillus ochraceoroseus]